MDGVERRDINQQCSKTLMTLVTISGLADLAEPRRKVAFPFSYRLVLINPRGEFFGVPLLPVTQSRLS